MNRRYQMNFEVGVPVARAWEAFTDPDELSRLLAPPPPEGAAEQSPYTQKVLEVDPMRLLRWSQEADHLADRAEFTVVFEATTDGTRLTITRDSFGEGEAAEVFSVSNGLGWEHGFRDLSPLSRDRPDRQAPLLWSVEELYRDALRGAGLGRRGLAGERRELR